MNYSENLYTLTAASKIVGAPNREIIDWCEKEAIVPYSQSPGKGHHRKFSVGNLFELKLARVLSEYRYKVSQCKPVLQTIRAMFEWSILYIGCSIVNPEALKRIKGTSRSEELSILLCVTRPLFENLELVFNPYEGNIGLLSDSVSCEVVCEVTIVARTMIHLESKGLFKNSDQSVVAYANTDDPKASFSYSTSMPSTPLAAKLVLNLVKTAHELGDSLSRK